MANFLFVLSKDDNEAATRCFQFAKIAHTKGHKTNLFFIDGGGYVGGFRKGFRPKDRHSRLPQ